MNNIEQRLVRIESRLVQIMLHMGIDPYKKMYDTLEDANKTTSKKKEAKNSDPAY